MKIVADTRMKNHGGIGTYLTNVLAHLDCVESLDIQAPIYSLKEHFLFSKKIPKSDCFWSPHFNAPFFPIQAKKRVITIHDLYHYDHFDPLSFRKKWYLKKIFPKVLALANDIVVVSNFTKQRLLIYFPELEPKITLIHSGADHLIGISPKGISTISPPFWLFVGNKKPHKNRSLIYQALLEFPEKKLVVVGEEEKVPSSIEKRVHFVNFAEDGELVWLYQNAECLLFPSFYEGWGFPPLEAMSLSCPVIVSNCGSLPEACGNGAIYFNSSEPKTFFEAIENLSKTRSKYIEMGRIWASQFIWEKTAKKHLHIFGNK